MDYPKKILHWIDGREYDSPKGEVFQKIDPAKGIVIAEVVLGSDSDVEVAVSSAQKAGLDWKNTPAITRGKILRKAADIMGQTKEELASVVALESGRSKKSALSEVESSIECAYFFAGEGQRYYGKVLQSANPMRSVRLIRESIGTGALFTPFNSPASSITWKAFPSILCGNTVVLKSHEYTPYIAVLFGQIFKKAGIPDGVFNVVQGTGLSVGVPLAGNKNISFISFTGSSKTGAEILKKSADRLAKVSIEGGGKNASVICDDADLEKAANDVIAGAFFDAGQRCSATSRVIIFEQVYESFKEILLSKIKKLSIGTSDSDDYGAIVSKERLLTILGAVERAKKEGAKILAGGERMSDGDHDQGFFMTPTVIEGVESRSEISQHELFGPVVVLFLAKSYDEAVALANDTDYGLSAAIHTRDISRAEAFIRDSKTGVVRVNGPTPGTEPHMPFGGVKLSGNGPREPGEEALDFYSEWKQVSIERLK